MDDTALLSLAADLARRAGVAILAIRERGFEVLHKEDASPVTAADHAAEALILEGLRAATPHIPVVAEEEVAGGKRVEAGEEYWLVDPLDGTRDFSAGQSEFTVNVGLVRGRAPVLGVVAAPALGELFCGIVGRGAWKRTVAGERPIAVRTPPEEGVAVVASRYHANDARLESFLAGRKVASISNFGSGLKFCRLAEGAADLYPRFGPTMEWDTAGPQAVLEGAGGTVSTLDGACLLYGKSGWRNPPFVCTGRPATTGGPERR